ncbi:hypothetical protein AB0M61_01450 [Streptomyces sp. NPDC051642]|uniref:hypothetical protein n=1 Tax=Streptomyces sp. NPDC051642 TaxID=3154646 RepID=UPI003429A9D8
MSDSYSISAHTGLVVQPYRTDQGTQAWVFRCWGSDTCDGALSLDHDNERSAIRALTSHYATSHTSSSATPETTVHVTGGLTERQRTEVAEIVRDAVRDADRAGRMSQ